MRELFSWCIYCNCSTIPPQSRSVIVPHLKLSTTIHHEILSNEREDQFSFPEENWFVGVMNSIPPSSPIDVASMKEQRINYWKQNTAFLDWMVNRYLLLLFFGEHVQYVALHKRIIIIILIPSLVSNWELNLFPQVLSTSFQVNRISPSLNPRE